MLRIYPLGFVPYKVVFGSWHHSILISRLWCLFQAVAGGLRGTNQCCTALVTTTRGGLGGDTALQVGRAATPSGAPPCLEKEEGTVNGSRANIAFQTSRLEDVAQRPIGRLETDERQKLWWGSWFVLWNCLDERVFLYNVHIIFC